MDFNVDEVKLFLEDTDEQIQTLEDNLILLEKDSSDIEVLNKLFRAAHTLKGSSATFGHQKMANLTHHLESVFEELRANKINVNDEVISVLLSTLDILRIIREDIEKEKDSVDVEQNIFELKKLLERKKETKKKPDLKNDNVFTFSAEEKQDLLDAEIKEKHLYKISLTLNENTELPAVRIIIIIEDLKNEGDIIKTLPDMQELMQGEDCFYVEVLFLSEDDESKIKNVFSSFTEVKDLTVIKTSVEELTSQTEKDNLKENKVEVKEKISQPKEQSIQEKYGAAQIKAKKTIRVDVERLEALMGITSELVIEKNKLIRLTNVISAKYEDDKEMKNLIEAKEQMDKKINILQDEIMKARMVPLDVVFNKFPRMIRDLASKSKKEITFNISGSNVELDKTVIEEISDPVIHLLRNAVDHGIKGSGEINLSARQGEGSVFIEVSDNGGGIDVERIKEIALEKSIVKENQIETLTQNEIINLIFAPGFSTAKEITQTSGRGVGLDIVKANIERIQGSVFIETVKGEGTKFILKIPLTLAIIKALLIDLHKQVFAIPLSSVFETLKINKSEIQTINKKETILSRGSVLPLFKLDKILGVSVLEESPQKFLKVVVVSYFDKRVGFIINNLLGESEIAVYSLGKFIGAIAGISGATIDAEGKVVLILDVPSLIRSTLQ